MGLGLVNPAVQSFNSSQRLVKTTTFDGSAGNGAVGTVAIATASGLILIRAAICYVTTVLTGAGAGLALGTTSSAGGLIAATAVNNQLDGGGNAFHVWATNSGTTYSVLLQGGVTNLYTEENIRFTVTTAAITAGVIQTCIMWDPVSAGATLT